MKKSFVSKVVTLTLSAALAMSVMTGCGETSAENVQTQGTDNTGSETLVAGGSITEKTQEEAKTENVSTKAPYFEKGVYVNYAAEAENSPHTYFYVFTGEHYGYTTDGANEGIGLPFSCDQTDGKVEFSFGGEEEVKDVFTVESAENGTVTGHFDDGLKLVFVYEADANPDIFDAVNYVNAGTGEDFVYNDANGWSVKYDPSKFEVNTSGPMTTFVYTGESAGTNMISTLYDVDKDAKTAIEDLAKEWGENATTSESIFPGTEDVKGYWAVLPPTEEGSRLYMTAIARDYMDGYLLFELTGHNSGDEELDMAVSDYMAAIIDSLTFTE